MPTTQGNTSNAIMLEQDFVAIDNDDIARLYTVLTENPALLKEKYQGVTLSNHAAHIAAYSGHLPCLELLASRGADLKKTSNAKETDHSTLGSHSPAKRPPSDEYKQSVKRRRMG